VRRKALARDPRRVNRRRAGFSILKPRRAKELGYMTEKEQKELKEEKEPKEAKKKKEPKEPKEKKEAKGKKEPKEAKEKKEAKGKKELEEPKEAEELAEPEELKALKEAEELEEPKEKKEAKGKKELEEPKEAEEAEELAEPEEAEELAEPEELKALKEPEELKEKKEPGEKKGFEEKPLDRMTAKELREVALGLEGIVGVHGMNKSELLAAVKKAKGIVDDKKRQTSVDVRTIKGKIRELRSQKEATKEAGDKKKMKILRRRINRLKKKTRRVAMVG
jgi:hypothetical protein